MKKSYPHKMLLNMSFAYNYILCYLGCFCVGYVLCLVVKRTRSKRSVLKQKRRGDVLKYEPTASKIHPNPIPFEYGGQSFSFKKNPKAIEKSTFHAVYQEWWAIIGQILFGLLVGYALARLLF